MSDRMLSDEILLGIINSKSGGGGGGTDDYNKLKNQPQINNNTLIGNKTASDLGLVAAEAGKGLSTNDYTNADKAIVGGVTAALAGKQDALTAGDYISIDANNEITVNREIPSVSASYELKTTSTSDPEINTDVIKRVNGEIVWQENYNYQTVRDNPVTIDDVFVLSYSGRWKYKLLVASDDHAAGYEQTWGWSAWVDYTENFSLVDNTGKKLIIKKELDTAINAIKDGTTIDSFADVETALSGKQDKSDNALQTTDKTVVGAVNELKSGLTNVDNATILNTQDLTTPSRTKNIMPIMLASIKALNTDGTWSGDSYTYKGVTFAVNTDANGNVTNISLSGTASGNVDLTLCGKINLEPNTDYIINGCPSGGSSSTYRIRVYESIWAALVFDMGNGYTFNSQNYDWTGARLSVYNGTNVDNKIVYPMIRSATITDPTFAPYIPSVESRIKAVESGKVNVATYNMGGGQTVNILHAGIVAIMSDRGGLYTDGITNRGLNDLIPSTQITVTHVDAYHVTVANNSQYGTSILVLSDGYITITLVQ